MQVAHMPMYLMPKQDLIGGIGTVILYRCLHFQDLRSMEKTSRWDGTDSDAKRIADEWTSYVKKIQHLCTAG
jgi:hypothetical protein